MSVKRKLERGYTLIELMVVVCIIGILATLAVYGVRKYVLAAKTAEPIEIINSVRAAEEAYKDETFAYLNVSDTASFYPFANLTELGSNIKKSWESGASAAPLEYANWNQLGVRPSAPVEFGYWCRAGRGNNVPSSGALGVVQMDLGYPASAPDWYVVRAAGERNGGGAKAIFVGSSFTDAIYGENETE